MNCHTGEAGSDHLVGEEGLLLFASISLIFYLGCVFICSNQEGDKGQGWGRVHTNSPRGKRAEGLSIVFKLFLDVLVFCSSFLSAKLEGY